MSFEIKNGSVFFLVDLRIYPLGAIYSAGYSLLEFAYIILDRKEESIVEIEISKQKGCSKDLEELRLLFYNELLNFSFHTKLSEKTSDIRGKIVEKALSCMDSCLDNCVGSCKLDKEDEEFLEELDKINNTEFDDPEGIAIPWEEKYGKDSDKKKDDSVIGAR